MFGFRRVRAALSRTPRVAAAVGLASALLLSACSNGSGDADSAPTPATANAQLAAGVVPLDTATLASVSASDDSSVTFEGTPTAVAALRVGQIFIANDTARKVVSVVPQSGRTVVSTTSPSLAEVVKALQVRADIELSDRYRVAPQALGRFGARRVVPTAVSVTTGSNGTAYTIVVTDSLVTGQVVLEKPRVELELNFGVIGPNYARARISAQESATLALAIPKLEQQAQIDIPLLAFKIPIAVTAGTVMFDVSIDLRLQADGSAELVAGVQQAAAVDANMVATLGPLKLESTSGTTNSFTVTQPSFTGALSAEIALTPSYGVRFLQYDLAGLSTPIGIVAVATASADTTNACARLQVSARYSGSGYLLVPTLSLQAEFTWDTFSTAADLSMQRVSKDLFAITRTLYDSGEQCVVENKLPVASAGTDVAAVAGATVLLDATASSDPDGTIASFQWSQVAGAPVTLLNADTATPSFAAPTSAGDVTLRVTVRDNAGATASDDIVVSVTAAPPVGEPPVAPSALAAEPGNARVTLRWPSVAGATGYVVYRATVSGVTPGNYGSLPGGARLTGLTSPADVPGLVNGTAYYFVVTAVNLNGEGAPSPQAAATPTSPGIAPPGVRHKTIAAGSYQACVIVGSGSVLCWLNSSRTSVPTPVPGISDAIQLSAGSDSVCALLSTGAISCWGGNTNGQLGNGTQTATTTPTGVTGITNAVAVAVNLTHACAVLSDGSARCWGNNTYAQLGTGSTGPNALAPVEVVGVSTATDVAVGYGYTCFVITTAEVKCLGNNQYGTLGAQGVFSYSPTLQTAQGLTNGAGVYGSADRTCAVLSSGDGSCWGYNTSGSLATGDCCNHPTPTPIAETNGIAALTLGSAHTCAVLADRTMRCAGFNAVGQLGTGNNIDSLTMQPVQGIADAVAAAAGSGFTCAVIGDGTVKCWGQTSAGTTNVPVPIPGITDAR